MNVVPRRGRGWYNPHHTDSKPKMTLPIRLDHCVIHVSDWERSNAFYRDVLGAELVQRPVGWAYRFGDTQLNLHGPGFKPAEVARLPVQPGNSDLCFEWNGPIAEAIAHLERRGVAVERGPMQRFGAKGDGTSVYFRDPDGSLLEFISYRGGEP
jgi:catechol 2,3-dioxygenase-like lactoylglutathione lyase family enzyme